MAKILSIIFFSLLPFSLIASGGQQRLAKKNVHCLFPNKNKTLLLNDQSGNLFIYDGKKLEKLELKGISDKSITLLESKEDFKIIAFDNTVYNVDNQNQISEILSLRPEETILSASSMGPFTFVQTIKDVYRINRNTNRNVNLFPGNISPTTQVICGSENCFLAQNNLILNPLKEGQVIAELPDEILAIKLFKDLDLIVLTRTGLFIVQEGISKRLHPVIGRFPDDIINIQNSSRWLYLILEQSCFVFDWQNSEINYLGDYHGRYLNSSIDNWSTLWISTTQGVWNMCAIDNFKGPNISTINITDAKGKSLEVKGLQLSESMQRVNVEAILSYLPNHESLITEWKTDKGSWRPFEKDFMLSSDVLDIGDNKISIRAKASNSDYTLPYHFTIQNDLKDNTTSNFVYLLFAVLASFLLFSVFSLFRLSSKQKHTNLQIKKLKAENELLQSQQQINQLKMNPHFIFNALTSINGLIASGEVKKGRKAITSFSKFLRQFLEQSQSESITIETELELLQNYVNIELLCRDNSFEFEIIEPKDELLGEKIPNMIIQPLIENAIIHAFKSNQENARIELSFEEENSYLIAKVADNGIGITVESNKNNGHKSIAIELIRKRLAQRDKNTRKNYLEYSDNNPGTIAKVYLKKLQ